MVSKQELIENIKKKKELSGLPDSFVLDALEEQLAKLGVKSLDLKKAQQKALVKLVRADLRKKTGMFQKVTEKLWKSRLELLEEGKIGEILETHASTKERLSFYPKLKEIISSLNVKSILDLGCGLNPLALASPEIVYYAVDIQKGELELIKKFFQKNNIQGKTISKDLSKDINLPPADLCLALKLFDILESKGHKQAENILKSISCRHFIISFSTKTLSGKPMLHVKRPWLERILNRLAYKFSIINSENEIFYIIERSS